MNREICNLRYRSNIMIMDHPQIIDISHDKIWGTRHAASYLSTKQLPQIFFESQTDKVLRRVQLVQTSLVRYKLSEME